LTLALVLQDPVAQIDAAAKARDIAGVQALASESLKANPTAFRFLRQNGTYGVGSKGWRAFRMASADGKGAYLVFTTPITSEDIGDQVFTFENGRLARFVDERSDLGVRIAHQKLEAWFDVPKKTARIETLAQFVRKPDAAGDFLIRFGSNYRVTAVLDGAGKPARFEQAGGVVTLPTPQAAEFAYRIRYEGLVDLPGYAGSISPNEIMLTNDYWYPMIARGPCAYELKVHGPKGWTAVGQGEFVSATDAATEHVSSFRMDVPVTFWSFSMAPYKRHSEVLNGRRYTVWSLTMPEDRMRIQPELFRPILEFYERFAKYPFSQWGAVDSPHYGGGALEAYSFATYGTGWLPDEDAHEPAHTWFGGLLNNGYLNSLWNESFANFCSGLFDREVSIGNRAERRIAFVSDANPNASFNAAPMAKSGAEIGPAASSLGYGKGALVLQMLEHEIGTEAIVKAMRDWIAEHPKGELAEWEHFESAVARTTGKDYKWFFDQWVRRSGWADFEVSDVKWVGGQVHGIVKFSGPKYHLTVDVMLEYPDGSREFKTCRIGPTPDSESSFPTVSAPRKPTLVSIDPWRKLLRRYGNDEQPVMLRTFQRGARRYTDPAHKDWLPGFGRSGLESFPADFANAILVGSPETLPQMKPLCDRVGFKVSGDKLTYDGTTIDLNAGAALAVVDLGDGKRCVIGIGKTLRAPSFGRARVALVDKYGRFLRGKTDPKTSGFLTFRL
jgi:hypothetical protein